MKKIGMEVHSILVAHRFSCSSSFIQREYWELNKKYIQYMDLGFETLEDLLDELQDYVVPLQNCNGQRKYMPKETASTVEIRRLVLQQRFKPAVKQDEGIPYPARYGRFILSRHCNGDRHWLSKENITVLRRLKGLVLPSEGSEHASVDDYEFVYALLIRGVLQSILPCSSEGIKVKSLSFICQQAYGREFFLSMLHEKKDVVERLSSGTFQKYFILKEDRAGDMRIWVKGSAHGITEEYNREYFFDVLRQKPMFLAYNFPAKVIARMQEVGICRPWYENIENDVPRKAECSRRPIHIPNEIRWHTVDRGQSNMSRPTIEQAEISASSERRLEDAELRFSRECDASISEVLWRMNVQSNTRWES